MKSNRWLILLVLVFALTLSACGTANEPTAIPTVVLDAPQSSVGTSPTGGATVTASATVLPVTSVELSFPLTGSVVTVAVADGDTVNAGDTLVQLDTAILQAKIAEAEANVTSATTQVSYLRRVSGSSKEDIEAAEAEVARQQAVLDAALLTLNQATLVAPIGGTVASVAISAGETVTPGLIVVTIGDLSKLQLETTDLSERDVPQVKIGQPVSIYLEALDQEVNGTVSYIAEQASSLGGDVIYQVKITLDETLPDLRWGMSAEVTINVEG